MAEDTTSSIESLVGLPDGDVVPTPGDAKDEKVVYDYDDNGQFTGWHKELV